MNVLISGLPKTVNVNGSPFLIKQNFSVWIAFTKLMLDKNIPNFSNSIVQESDNDVGEILFSLIELN